MAALDMVKKTWLQTAVAAERDGQDSSAVERGQVVQLRISIRRKSQGQLV